MRGPIDYIVVGFEGNKFDGSILGALRDALHSGVIGMVALAFVSKDAEGKVFNLDIEKLTDSYAVTFIEEFNPNLELVTSEDIEEVAGLLANNTAAGLLVIEQLWAKPLKAALIEANGVLVAEGRIHPDAALELNNEED